MRKDISQLQYINEGKGKNTQNEERLEKKYNTNKKGTQVVIEELKQRVTAKAVKIRRYESRINFFQQNRLFQNNQRRLFEQLEGRERDNTIIPDAEESKTFWRGIWSEEVYHNEKAEWLKEVERKLGTVEKQQNIKITPELIEKQAKKLPNWKAPGPDGLQGFWLKNIKSVRKVLAKKLKVKYQNG